MMEDKAIIELYWQRDETAIRESDQKYGKLCRYVAGNILASREDTEECINDTWLGAWDSMPEARPEYLSAFLCRIARNQALKRADYNQAAKRKPEVLVSLEELGDCVSEQEDPLQQYEAQWLGQQISKFLWDCDREQRIIFLRRYWYYDSVSRIAERFGISESKVKSLLYRMRRKLKKYLEQEGVQL